MKYLLFILILFLNIVSQNLLPLQLGNKWIYQDENRKVYEIVLDTTVIFNGFEYLSYQKEFSRNSTLLRLREAGYYESTPLSNPIVWDYYKIDAQLGDVCSIPQDSSVPGFTPYYEVKDTILEIIFGKIVTVNVLNLDGGIIARSQYWTEEFGMLSGSITPFDDVVARLRGCIINSITYGDTSLISGIEEKDEILNNDYVLNQNYANHFNHTTSIKHTLYKRPGVNLEVCSSRHSDSYNNSGRINLLLSVK